MAMGGEAPGPRDGEGRSIPPNDMINSHRVHTKLLSSKSRNQVWASLHVF